MEQQTEDLINIRESVETLDQQLLEMIATRRQLSQKIATHKQSNGTSIRNFPVEQTRLSQLIEKGQVLGIDPFSVSKFYQNVIEDSVLTQHAHLQRLENVEAYPANPRVAFLGGQGAYSQFAARKYFSFLKDSICEEGQEDFQSVLEALESDRADYAVLPVQNSTTGLIDEAAKALLASKSTAVGEIYLPIEHCLLAQNWDYPISGLRRIYGHPQVFAQCKAYLSGLKGVELVPVESTHHALKAVANGRVNEAAIGSAVAGSIFGLKTPKSNLQGNAQNITRFLVLSTRAHRVPSAVEAKTTIAISPLDQSSILSEILLELMDRDISTSSLEALQGAGGLGDKTYILDIYGPVTDQNIAAALSVINDKTESLKILGSYPSGKISNFFAT